MSEQTVTRTQEQTNTAPSWNGFTGQTERNWFLKNANVNLGWYFHLLFIILPCLFYLFCLNLFVKLSFFLCSILLRRIKCVLHVEIGRFRICRMVRISNDNEMFWFNLETNEMKHAYRMKKETKFTEMLKKHITSNYKNVNHCSFLKQFFYRMSSLLR